MPTATTTITAAPHQHESAEERWQRVNSDLHEAAAEGNVTRVERLLARGGEPFSYDTMGNTALHTALVFYSMRAGSSIGRKGGVSPRPPMGMGGAGMGPPPADMSAGHSPEEFIAKLASLLGGHMRDHINAPNAAKDTPLHVVAQHACLLSCVGPLVSLGADVNAINGRGETVAYAAAAKGNMRAADLLMGVYNARCEVVGVGDASANTTTGGAMASSYPFLRLRSTALVASADPSAAEEAVTKVCDAFVRWFGRGQEGASARGGTATATTCNNPTYPQACEQLEPLLLQVLYATLAEYWAKWGAMTVARLLPKLVTCFAGLLAGGAAVYGSASRGDQRGWRARLVVNSATGETLLHALARHQHADHSAMQSVVRYLDIDCGCPIEWSRERDGLTALDVALDGGHIRLAAALLGMGAPVCRSAVVRLVAPASPAADGNALGAVPPPITITKPPVSASAPLTPFQRVMRRLCVHQAEESSATASPLEGSGVRSTFADTSASANANREAMPTPRTPRATLSASDREWWVRAAEMIIATEGADLEGPVADKTYLVRHAMVPMTADDCFLHLALLCDAVPSLLPAELRSTDVRLAAIARIGEGRRGVDTSASAEDSSRTAALDNAVGIFLTSRANTQWASADTAVLKALLTAGSDPRAPVFAVGFPNGMTPLGVAIMCGYAPAVRLLLAHCEGVIMPPEASDSARETPLQLAARLPCPNADVIAALLSDGADTEAVDGNGCTPLDVLASSPPSMASELVTCLVHLLNAGAIVTAATASKMGLATIAVDEAIGDRTTVL